MTSSAACTTNEASGTLIVYDGDCIYCRNYVQLMRLRETVGPVTLVNARSDDALARRFWKEGYDLNAGMILVYRGKVYHGADAVNTLALLSTRSSLFNRLNRFLFSSRTISRMLYPLLRLGRRITLLIRGKRLLREPN